VRILFDFEQSGLDLLGIYHSHPSGPPIPSEVDRHEAAYPGAVHLICSQGDGGWTCQAFSIDERGLVSRAAIEWAE
jgi:proteasome lid subunit RPN8/RPN11